MRVKGWWGLGVLALLYQMGSETEQRPSGWRVSPSAETSRQPPFSFSLKHFGSSSYVLLYLFVLPLVSGVTSSSEAQRRLLFKSH